MSHFCLLKDPQQYVAHSMNLVGDSAGQTYWLDLFANHFEETLKAASMRYGRTVGRQIVNARQAFNATLSKLRESPGSLPSGKLNVMELCRQREKALRDNRLNDPFGHVKQRENASAAKLYPTVVRRLHSLNGQEKWFRLIEAVFAGNIFDLGCTSTFHLSTQPTDFLATVENVRPRPWRVDDFDRLSQDLPDAPPTKWSKIIFFVDNAGSDFILGVMPLARELALYGSKIVLAANEVPSLNDITVDETVEVVEQLAAADPDLAALISGGMFEVVSTGNDIPLIDLSNVSDELNEAAADADMVILEGMGRAVESNFDADFKVDSLRLAMLKDPRIAAMLGGEVFDCVCKYTPAT